jgi:hypothetical protein
MSLNSINLNTLQVARFYGHSLVETTAEAPASDNQELRYLGNNKKAILLLVSYPEAAFLPDAELAFLTNILAACKLGLADVAILNLGRTEGRLPEEALDLLAPRQVLLFGIEPLQIGLPIQFPPYQLQPFNGRTYLVSPELSALEGDKALKLKLWNCLKTLFDI